MPSLLAVLSPLSVQGFLPQSARQSTFLVPHTTSSSSTLLMAGRRNNNRNNRGRVEREPAPTMNEEITQSTLRVLAPNPNGKDEPLGVLTREEALAKAKELGGLDLILVNDKSDPPICKIVDYSKFRYAQEKKAKELKKNSKTSEVKEVKMSYKIDVHDYGVRKKNAMKFLKQGNRVKCTVMFRGREVQHDNLGIQLLDKLALELEDVCVREGRAKREGRNLSLILGPRPEVMKALNDSRKAEEKAKKQKKAEQKAKVAGAPSEEKNTPDVVSLEEDDDDDDFDVEQSLEELLGGEVKDEMFS